MISVRFTVSPFHFYLQYQPITDTKLMPDWQFIMTQKNGASSLLEKAPQAVI
jgi:hypothetical protein